MSTINLPLIYSGRVRSALQLAEQAHRGVNRKSGDHPFLLHLVAVTTVLAAADADDDLLCAGFLHDSVEDTEISSWQLEDQFGTRVAQLVEAVTKIGPVGDEPAPSKADIARQTEEKMAGADVDAVALKTADLIANVSDLIIDQQQQGYAHWNMVFRSSEHAELKITHYLRLADIVLGRLAYYNAYPVLGEHLRARADQLRQLFSAWEH